MSLIAEFRIRSPDLVLAPTVSVVTSVTLEVVTEIAMDPQQPYLFFWARGDDLGAFEAAMADDPTVATVERYDELDDRSLYRIQVSEETDVVSYPTWVEAGVTLFQARWRDGWWHDRMRFPDRDALAHVKQWCVDNGVEFELEGVYDSREAGTAEPTLTSEQHQVLTTAHELGYFEVPREASMADVAAALDISNQAVSERLRRGYRRLVEETLL